MHICAECNVENDLIAGTPGNDPIEREEARVSVLHPTKRKTTKGKASKIEQFTAKETKDAYCPEATTQVGMIGLDFHVDQIGLLVQT